MRYPLDLTDPRWDDCVVFPGRMPPREIGFVNCLLDDLDGMVVVRTEDAVEGRMEFWVSPDMVDEFQQFIAYCREGLSIPVELGRPIRESTELTEFKDSLLKQNRSDGNGEN